MKSLDGLAVISDLPDLMFCLCRRKWNKSRRISVKMWFISDKLKNKCKALDTQDCIIVTRQITARLFLSDLWAPCHSCWNTPDTPWEGSAPSACGMTRAAARTEWRPGSLGAEPGIYSGWLKLMNILQPWSHITSTIKLTHLGCIDSFIS